MSLSDAPKQVNLQDVYPEGTAFKITSAWVEGQVETQYGARTMAKALIEPAAGGSPQEFALWGSLCEQVQQIEEGDIPGVYAVKKEGKRWLFVPAAAPEPAPAAATPDEAALGLKPAPGEGAAPAAS